MKSQQLTQAPVAKTEILIRKPVAEVFEAFIDPAITFKFWFTQGSGRLEPGKQIQWDWEMFTSQRHAADNENVLRRSAVYFQRSVHEPIAHHR